MGRVAIIVIVVMALIAGGALYYLQVYAYYDTVPPTPAEVQLTSVATGLPEPIPFDDFTGIDSDSSPIRYRACFTTPLSLETLTATFVLADNAEPLTGPGWFGCFDAGQIGGELAAGDAIAFMGTENIRYGIDRVVAVYPDGRGFVWHQINPCGAVVFDGNPAPENCPPVPESLR
ncbi:DUF6446 family protein [Yoonia sp.]|uniref:DUF6446 family protein n=1 Tax=Yoonia sp. TaxID=2212373 RepID=UPI001A07D9D5|nr:DUF6446 family protein [Yoonia sp.]MBE0414063.1 histidine kinase [Yoonia sp.]